MEKEFETIQALLDEMTMQDGRRVNPGSQPASLSELVSDLQEKVERLSTEARVSEAAATRARKDLDDAQGQVLARDEELADLYKQLRQARDNKAAQKATEAAQAAECLNTQLETLTAQHSDLVRAHDKTVEELVAVTAKRHSLQEEVGQLTNDLLVSFATAETEQGKREQLEAELKQLKHDHQQLQRVCTNYRVDWAQKVASLPIPAVGKPPYTNLFEIRQFLARVGIRLAVMSDKQWLEIANCVEQQQLRSIPCHEEWRFTPPPINFIRGQDMVQVECLHVLASLQCAGNLMPPYLTGQVTRLCSFATALRTPRAMVDLIALTLLRLLAHETAGRDPEHVFMAAVVASSLGLQEVADCVTEVLSSVPAADAWDRVPFDGLSRLALAEGFTTDVVRRHCERYGVTMKDPDMGMLMAPDVYVMFEFERRQVTIVEEHQTKHVKFCFDESGGDLEFCLVDERVVRWHYAAEKRGVVFPILADEYPALADQYPAGQDVQMEGA